MPDLARRQACGPTPWLSQPRAPDPLVVTTTGFTISHPRASSRQEPRGQAPKRYLDGRTDTAARCAVQVRRMLQIGLVTVTRCIPEPIFDPLLHTVVREPQTSVLFAGYALVAWVRLVHS
jgi:hypothetical protein